MNAPSTATPAATANDGPYEPAVQVEQEAEEERAEDARDVRREVLDAADRGYVLELGATSPGRDQIAVAAIARLRLRG